MASTSNKVRFGLKNVYYALYDEDTKTYGTPTKLAGAVNISFEPQGSQTNFYADDVVYYVSSPTATDSGSLEIADLTDDAAVDLLGYKKDENGVVREATNAVHPTFALLYQQAGDGNTKRGIRYNVTLNRPTEGAQTTEESVEPNTLTLEYTAAGRDFVIGDEVENIIKAYVTDAGDTHAVYDAWFESVYVFGEAPADATLATLTVGTLTLSPTFDPDVTTYTVSTTNDTNAVTATANDEGATVSITVNGSSHTSGNSATWEAGQNVVSVVVTNDGVTKAYTVVVTKGE